MLTDRPDMTLDVYRGRKTTMQQQQQQQRLNQSWLLTMLQIDFAGVFSKPCLLPFLVVTYFYSRAA